MGDTESQQAISRNQQGLQWGDWVALRSSPGNLLATQADAKTKKLLLAN